MTDVVTQDSAARVALELAYHISTAEKDAKKDRAYWQTLVQECRRVVDGKPPKQAGAS